MKPSVRKLDRKYCMKIQDIPNISPAALLRIYPDMNPGRILKRQISKNLRKTEAVCELTVYTDNWQYARHSTGMEQRMQMHCI